MCFRVSMNSLKWIVYLSILQKEPLSIFFRCRYRNTFPLFKFLPAQNFRGRCPSGDDLFQVMDAEPQSPEQALSLLIIFDGPFLSWGELPGLDGRAGEAKYFAELLHSLCVLCLLLFRFRQHEKHLPFSINDHFLGLVFSGESLFFTAPVFSRRPREVLSLLASSGFFRLFGRKQNGIADRKLAAPPIKKPSHHAPTQRESCGVIVMLPRNEENRHRLSQLNLPNLYLLWQLHFIVSDFQQSTSNEGPSLQWRHQESCPEWIVSCSPELCRFLLSNQTFSAVPVKLAMDLNALQGRWE